MPETPSLTSSEYGVIWITYQEKTLTLRMLEYFIEKADDEQAKKIMQDLYNELAPYNSKIIKMFEEEGAPPPVGFTEKDVNKGAPKLYDHGFDIMLTRLLMEISMGMHTLDLNMAYRKDVIQIFRELTSITQKYYEQCTLYLLEKGLMVRSPYSAIPTSVEFVHNYDYLSGLNPWKQKRPLNMVELAHLYHLIEANTLGLQLILGFSQCAHEKDVQQYFKEGAAIAKQITKAATNTLIDSDIQVPTSAGGNVTNSTSSPFSDKLMMYCVSLFCSFAIGGSSIGTAFSQRHDLVVKISKSMQDVYAYAHKGAKIMIKHEWMEEPPQTKIKKLKS